MEYLIVIAKYVLYFMLYAFAGWLLEVIVAYFNQRKFVNRGFLIGPYCPIYGYGIILIILLIGKNRTDLLGIFLKSMVIAGVLEYFTSYFMEKIYKFRWWDYSNKKYNINGRVCLETLIPFGLLGLLFYNYIHPSVVSLVDKLPNEALLIIASVLLVIYIIDNIISNKMLYKISSKVSRNAKDNTIEIKKQFIKWYREQSKLYRRIEHAFPNFEEKLKEHKKMFFK